MYWHVRCQACLQLPARARQRTRLAHRRTHGSQHEICIHGADRGQLQAARDRSCSARPSPLRRADAALGLGQRRCSWRRRHADSQHGRRPPERGRAR